MDSYCNLVRWQKCHQFRHISKIIASNKYHMFKERKGCPTNLAKFYIPWQQLVYEIKKSWRIGLVKGRHQKRRRWDLKELTNCMNSNHIVIKLTPIWTVRNKKYPAFLLKWEHHMAINSLELSDKPFTWLAPNSMSFRWNYTSSFAAR